MRFTTLTSFFSSFLAPSSRWQSQPRQGGSSSRSVKYTEMCCCPESDGGQSSSAASPSSPTALGRRPPNSTSLYNDLLFQPMKMYMIGIVHSPMTLRPIPKSGWLLRTDSSGRPQMWQDISRHRRMSLQFVNGLENGNRVRPILRRSNSMSATSGRRRRVSIDSSPPECFHYDSRGGGSVRRHSAFSPSIATTNDLWIRV